MPFDVRALADAIRKAAPARAWSRGVVIAREECVEGRSSNDEEIVLSVRVPERPVPLTVVFYPETMEWDCECDSSLDACAHAAGAIIALAQAREAGLELPGGAKKTPKIAYRFLRDATGARLLLERKPLINVEQMKRAAAAGELALEAVDLSISALLPGANVEVTHVEQAARLLAALEDSTEVYLDGRPKPVRTSRRELMPRGVVTGDANNAVFVIEKNPELEEVIGTGIARAGNQLLMIGELGLSGVRLEKLPIERRFAKKDFAELVAEVLPIYRRRFEVEVKNSALPALRGRGTPRLELNVAFEHDGVAALPELVYGRPPRVRIEDKRAVYLQGDVPERDHAQEQRLVEQLRSGLNLITGRRVFVRGADATAFLGKLRKFQGESGDEDQHVVPELGPRFGIDADDRFTLGFETEDGARAEPAQVLRAYANGEALVPLLGGGWAQIPRGFLAQHGDRIALLLQLRSEDGRVPLLATPALAELAVALDHPPPRALDRLAPLIADFEQLPSAVLPGDLQATLRAYQTRGVDWLHFLRDAGLGAVLADDMGLGKTLQAICALEGRALIVCPTSVLPNWAAELVRFRPGLSVSLYHGPGRALDAKANVTLTTYALLRIDQELLAKEAWDVAVLDEAQAIKNADSQTARAAYALQAKWKVALTGTPIENRLEELWSQLHFTNPGLLLGRSEFTARYAKPIAAGDEGAAKRLRERIRPFVLRRLKREVAKELPPRTEMVLYAELDEKERAVYDAVYFATKKEVVAKLAEGSGVGVLAVLEALLRLRQAACHSALVPGGEGAAAAGSAKTALLVETLLEAIDEGHKALVFSQWTSLLDLLEPELRSAGIEFVRLDGSTRDRGAVVSQFQSEGGPPLMLISLKAGGTGLNLTAADHVFLFDPWWNPAVEDQAADRAHRIGQERPVMIYRLVARATIEERILELQARKRAVANIALGEAGAAAHLTKDDLLALLL